MGNTGDAYDKAVAERLFATPKVQAPAPLPLAHQERRAPPCSSTSRCIQPAPTPRHPNHQRNEEVHGSRHQGPHRIVRICPPTPRTPSGEVADGLMPNSTIPPMRPNQHATGSGHLCTVPRFHEAAITRLGRKGTTSVAVASGSAAAPEHTGRPEPLRRRGKPADECVASRAQSLAKRSQGSSAPASGASNRSVISRGGPTLAPRNIELLRLISDDLTNKDIAARLGIATDTVKDRLHQVYRRLVLQREFAG